MAHKNKKYKLAEDKEQLKLNVDGKSIIFYRIVALNTFSIVTGTKPIVVNKGDIGGWIESEHNLSHDGNCWIFDDAVVLDKAVVKDYAIVKDNAVIADNAIIMESAKVSGHCQIYNNAVVSGFAEISGEAKVFENANAT